VSASSTFGHQPTAQLECQVIGDDYSDLNYRFWPIAVGGSVKSCPSPIYPKPLNTIDRYRVAKNYLFESGTPASRGYSRNGYGKRIENCGYVKNRD
jgi:hypothetical protein